MNQSSAPEAKRLLELDDLKQKGTITEEEFLTLKSANAPSASRYGSVLKSELSRWILLICLIAGTIAVDHLKGSIFPDFVYCAAGAGVELHRPAERRANSWMAGNGCGAPDPRCAKSWIEIPASSVCLHGTLWEAIKKKIP